MGDSLISCRLNFLPSSNFRMFGWEREGMKLGSIPNSYHAKKTNVRLLVKSHHELCMFQGRKRGESEVGEIISAVTE